MNDFCDLFWQLDSTTKTNEKVEAIKRYLDRVHSRDAAWATYFLTGSRMKRLLPLKLVRQWATEQAGLQDWLFAECYDRVGDLAETISLILPPPSKPNQDWPLHEIIEDKLLPLRNASLEQQKRTVLGLWDGFDQPARFVLGKLITGGFRVGVSKRLVNRAIAEWSGIEATTIAHRMMGVWEPTEDFFKMLIDPHDDGSAQLSRPYPFFLANPVKDAGDLFQPPFGDAKEWVAEWKWDGIRAQLIKREGSIFLWSRGEELVTHQFPEIARAANSLPDGVVLDGEVLAWSENDGRPREFQQLQKRLGRKNVSAKTMAEVPVAFLVFDLLEYNGQDVRKSPLCERQKQLGKLVSQLLEPSASSRQFLFEEMESTTKTIQLPPAVQGNTWEDWKQERERSNEMRAEGLMLKRKSSEYQVNRPVGDWWKWKVDPFTVDAVLIYAQRGHGRRASLYTDYTFAVWDAGELVPFAKAYSGLSDEEIREVDAFVRKNTHERFGPVRSVTPELVFELAFENIQFSPRHKSGIAVRFPRISRWRHDKKPADADSLNSIKNMIPK